MKNILTLFSTEHCCSKESRKVRVSLESDTTLYGQKVANVPMIIKIIDNM